MTDIDISNYTRVSSILSMIPTLDSEGKWGFPMQQLDQDMLQRKADLGTAVHDAIESHILGKFHPSTDKEDLYIESFKKWESSVTISEPITERRFFYDPMNLTGKIDLIAKLPHSPLSYIFDYKCTVAEEKKKWPMQAAFYHFLARVNGIKVNDEVFFLRLDPKGGYPAVYEYHIDEKLRSQMISIYNSYMYLTQK
jgi:hypothetical protein